ncbi:transcriptional regulatory protein ZraR [bacterium BMS3Abin07]|nr:transcriptional regulatory protein ZraR [bacterium BMS3Abin07]
MTGNGNILIVDDEPNAVKVLSSILSDEGYDVRESLDVDGAVDIILNNDIDAVITDLKMPGRDGMQFFEYVTKNHPDIPVIFLTAYGTVESAVSAMTGGAFYYFIKPPDYPRLKGILARAVEQRCLKREIDNIKNELLKGNNSYRIIGSTSQISDILEICEAVKDSESNVLVSGETGTGKELIALNIHYRSKRYKKPFIAVNCAAIPGELIESELFGHEKGAFTGAASRRIGKFEEASDGTVFLDEIGELGLPLQAKLLRVLQEREIERLGSNKNIKVNFRLITSTNRDLKKEIIEGNFREDLFYRINVVQIDVPPLRERRDDIPLLVTDFLREFCVKANKTISISKEAMDIFMKYSWPGNIRHLRNVIERTVVLARGKKIAAADLPEELIDYKENIKTPVIANTLKELEFHAIKKALDASNGNKSRAAKILGISRKAFYKRLRDYRLI